MYSLRSFIRILFGRKITAGQLIRKHVLGRGDTDNLKAAVERADRYEPTINRTMEEFANHYGTVVDSKLSSFLDLFPRSSCTALSFLKTEMFPIFLIAVNREIYSLLIESTFSFCVSLS